MASRQQQIEEALRGQVAGEIRQQLEDEATGLRAPLAQMRQRSRELSAQEAELSGQLAGEQSRWMEFNNRIDQVDREIGDRK
jgi:hypothetical protein